VEELALLQAWVYVPSSRRVWTRNAACKCANYAEAEFQNILCGGKKIKHNALGYRG